jgi:carboxymethylenebutenolidase
MCHEVLTAPVQGGDGLAESAVTIPSGEIEVPATLVEPENRPAPGVVIVHDIWGANAFYQDVARRLAGEGFTVLLPDFFVREGPLPEPERAAAMARRERMDQATALRDIEAAIRWLRDYPSTSGRVGAIGFCMGGTLVLLAATEENAPDGVVGYYGFPAGHGGWPRRPLDEVDRLRVPVLGLWGDQDHGVGMEHVEAFRQSAAEAERDVETVIYPGLPHGFLTFDPLADHVVQAADSWSRTVVFLHDQLDS